MLAWFDAEASHSTAEDVTNRLPVNVDPYSERTSSMSDYDMGRPFLFTGGLSVG